MGVVPSRQCIAWSPNDADINGPNRMVNSSTLSPQGTENVEILVDARIQCNWLAHCIDFCFTQIPPLSSLFLTPSRVSKRILSRSWAFFSRKGVANADSYPPLRYPQGRVAGHDILGIPATYATLLIWWGLAGLISICIVRITCLADTHYVVCTAYRGLYT